MLELIVLITHVSYQAATGSFIKMLRTSKKYICRIIGCDSIPKGYSSGSMLVDAFYHLPFETGSTEYLSSIIQICEYEKVNIILSAEEEDLLLFAKHNIPQFMCESIACASMFELFRDKHLANLKMESNHIDVPKTIECFNQYKESCKDKFIYRKRVSCCSRGIQVLKKEQIEKDYVFFSQNHITQEYAIGDLYTIDVLCDKIGNICLAVPRKTISEKDGTTFKCLIEYNENLFRICKSIYSIFRVPGISNIQFIVENNQPYFIELNPRAAATVIASSLVSVNILDLYISHFLFCEDMPSFNSLMKTVDWNSVVSRYYQETIMSGGKNV